MAPAAKKAKVDEQPKAKAAKVTKAASSAEAAPEAPETPEGKPAEAAPAAPAAVTEAPEAPEAPEEPAPGTAGATDSQETQEASKEPEPAKELEADAAVDKQPKIKDTITFHVEDTTMNVLPSSFGNMLMPLTDGGLQYLLAGARASVGVKAGRYMFEVKIIEVINPADDPAARPRTPLPRSQLRVGFATAASSLFIGETEDSVCFDTEGAFIHNKTRSMASQRFAGDTVVAVVLNLDPNSPNANTVSLFKNGVRACQPQPLPENLHGKALFPALTFKNLTVHYNFGPLPLAPLPFRCNMVQQATVKDAVMAPVAEKPKDGKCEVVFPVALPDEGGFDWLDAWLEKNPSYTELTDRAVLAWAEASGLTRPKGYAARSSNDKPEMGFGIAMMDDSSVRKVLQAVAPIQQRNYVVLEVKSNLVKDERKDLLSRWPPANFKRIAAVLVGEPPVAFKKRSQDLLLKQKQEASDAEFRLKKAEEKRRKLMETRQKQLEREKKRMLKKQKKAQEELKKRLELEKKKKEAAEKGEPFVEEEAKEAKEAKEAEEEKDSEEEPEDQEMAEAEAEAEAEEPPKVELAAEEKALWFRKAAASDLTPYALNTSFTKFSVPEKEEGFDEVRHEWQKAEKAKEYLKQWIQDRKLTTRVEDLQPGEWFLAKWKEWQKALQLWNAKQTQYKAAVAKKAADAAAKEAKKVALKAAQEAKAAQAARLKEAKAKAAKAAQEAAQEAQESKEAEEGEEVKETKESEEPAAEDAAEASAEPGQPEEKAQEEDVAMEDAEEEEQEEEKVDFDRLDVFGVEDILDIGGGEPLFSAFNFEDWTMMGLRFELHLLTHAFRRDVNDPDRIGIHSEHLPFYYNKYFKKPWNLKFYGVETTRELLDFVRDTVVVNPKSQVIEPQLPDDMESFGVFVMLTEESRRDRTRRVDLGDESARLKLSQQGVVPLVAVAARIGAPAVAPGAVNPPPAARPFQASVVAPQLRPAQNWYAAQGMHAPVAPRPFVAGWQPAAARRPGW